MKRFFTLFLLLLIAGLARPVVGMAEDAYTDYDVTAIDTAPTDCSLADGCANVQARAVEIENTGNARIFARCDVPVTFSTTGMKGIGPSEKVTIGFGGTTCKKVFMKTTSDTSTATVRAVK